MVSPHNKISNARSIMSNIESMDGFNVISRTEVLGNAELVFEIDEDCPLKRVLGVDEMLRSTGFELLDGSDIGGRVVYEWDAKVLKEDS